MQAMPLYRSRTDPGAAVDPFSDRNIPLPPPVCQARRPAPPTEREYRAAVDEFLTMGRQLMAHLSPIRGLRQPGDLPA